MSSIPHETNVIRSGVPMRLKYATTQRNSAFSTEWRTVLPDRLAPASETTFGKAGDKTPGWWMQQGEDDKWFAPNRILAVTTISEAAARRFDDCPIDLLTVDLLTQAAPDRGASPARSRSTSRSRSRSRSRDRSAEPTPPTEPSPPNPNSPLF